MKKVKKRGVAWLLVAAMVITLFPVMPKSIAEAATNNIYMGTPVSAGGYYSYPNASINLTGTKQTLNFLSISVNNGYMVPTVTEIKGLAGKGIYSKGDYESADDAAIEDLKTTGRYEAITFTVSDGADLDACEAVIRGIHFVEDANAQEEQKITVYGSNMPDTKLKDPSNPWVTYDIQFFDGHYYAFISQSWTSWKNSYQQAKALEYGGLKGYLMTLYTQPEDRFVYAAFENQTGWMGATRATTTDGVYDVDNPLWSDLVSWDTFEVFEADTTNRIWRWACGPENAVGNKGAFGYQTSAGFPGKTSGGFTAYEGWFSNWGASSAADKEPNGGGSSYNQDEGYGYYAVKFDGSWNDHPDTGSKPYYVEFGGYDDDAEKAAAAGNVIVKTVVVGGNVTVLERENTPATYVDFEEIRNYSNGDTTDKTARNLSVISGFVPDAKHTITVYGDSSGKEYVIFAGADGTIPVAGTDENGQPYNFKEEVINIIKNGDNILTIDSYPQQLIVTMEPAKREETPNINQSDDLDYLENFVAEEPYTIKDKEGNEYKFVPTDDGTHSQDKEPDKKGSIPVAGKDANGKDYDFTDQVITIIKEGDWHDKGDSLPQELYVKPKEQDPDVKTLEETPEGRVSADKAKIENLGGCHSGDGGDSKYKITVLQKYTVVPNPQSALGYDVAVENVSSQNLVYDITAAADGTVPLKGTDEKGRAYDLTNTYVTIVKTACDTEKHDDSLQQHLPVLTDIGIDEMGVEKIPEAIPDYRENKLTNLEPNEDYTITTEDGVKHPVTTDDEGKVPFTGKDDDGNDYDLNNQEIEIVKKGEHPMTIDSPAQKLKIEDPASHNPTEKNKERTPDAKPNYTTDKLDNLVPNADYEITVGGVTYPVKTDENGNIPIKGKDKDGKDYDLGGKDISIVKKGNGDTTTDSDPQPLKVLQREKTPEAKVDGSNLTNLVKNADYEITVGGVVYPVKADENGNIPIKGTDKNGKEYDFTDKLINIVKKGDNVNTIDSYAQPVTVTVAPSSAADQFIKDHLTDPIDGGIITKVDDSTRDLIVSGKQAWEALSDADKAKVNNRLKAAGCDKTYPELLAEAENYKIPGFKVTKLMQKKTRAKLKRLHMKGANIVVTSTNKKIATVSKKGVIKAKKPGVATVTYVAVKGKYTARYIVKVKVRKKFKNAKEMTYKKSRTKVIKTPAVLISKQRKLGRSSRIKVFDLDKSSKVKYAAVKKNVLKINKKGKYKGRKKGDTVVRINVRQNDKLYKLYAYVRIY